MKIILLLGSLFFSGIIPKTPTTVYVCDRSNGTKYHYTSTCRGLKNCQHRILKTTMAVAKSKGKTLCAWEN